MIQNYVPGQLAREWRKAQTTGSLRAADVFAEMPTQEIRAVRPVRLQRDLRTEPIKAYHALPLDEVGRPYLQIVNDQEETWHLVWSAVERFRQVTGNYPVVICLSAFRYLTIGALKHFYPGDIHANRIPYDYQGPGYDVLVRGQ